MRKQSYDLISPNSKAYVQSLQLDMSKAEAQRRLNLEFGNNGVRPVMLKFADRDSITP